MLTEQVKALLGFETDGIRQKHEEVASTAVTRDTSPELVERAGAVAFGIDDNE